MRFSIFTTLICSFLITSLIAQSDVDRALSRFESLQQFNDHKTQSLVGALAFENIGPSVCSGRVTDIKVNPNNPTEFVVAYATGGLWITKNNGTSFDPIYDGKESITIGAFDVDWQNRSIWLGTGEVNSSRSSYQGTGMYFSPDMGQSWVSKGLLDSHHIGRVIIHPNDNNRIYVAVLGHLYSHNENRGVYISNDGGETWTKSLYIDEHTGAVDLILNPKKPLELYAAMWDRERSAWNFRESGTGSGIYKSTDDGNTWTNITENGFPKGEGTGRIGLSMSHQGDTTRIYALLDNYNRRPAVKQDKKTNELEKSVFKTMTKDQFKELKADDLDKFLRKNNFPKKYTADKVKSMVESGQIEVKAIVEYLENANSLLFDTPVIGAELYLSDDGGNSWRKTHDGYLDGVYNSYGYYFGMVSAHPNKIDEVVIAGVPMLRSVDGGKNFVSIGAPNVHVDHHALWINPKKDGHYINGNDGGVNVSYDAGEHWIKCNTPAVGQFYHINVDMAEPYNVYGGLQDNGVWYADHNYQASVSWHNSGHYPYKSIMGGDGMQTQIDNRDNTTVYTGFQFGNYFRIDRNTGERSYITPKHELGERPYRWNWQSPIIISDHNQDIIYLGANKLFRSFDKGENFEAISGDLTNGGKKGDVPYGTLTSISESKEKFGLIYTGSDDGKVYRTDDGGANWQDISAGLPQHLWISRIQASAHNDSTVYVSLNGYRNDDFNPYVYRSEDRGNSWRNISKGLPQAPINVIKEDVKNKDLIFVGTDIGTFVSVDAGENYMAFDGQLPNVPVHDLVIHPREGDLLIGTHGRSIYKASIKSLRKLSSVREKSVYVFSPLEWKYGSYYGKKYNAYRKITEPKFDVEIYSNKKQTGELIISTSEGKELYKTSVDLPLGISTLEYDMSMDPKRKKTLEKYLEMDKNKLDMSDNGKLYLRPGKYLLKLKVGKHSSQQELTVL